MSVITVWTKPREKRFPSYENLDEEEREILIRKFYKHYKEQGFPYLPTDLLWKHTKMEQLRTTNYIDLLEEDNSIRQSMTGCAIGWSYMPHAFSVRCGDRKTPYEVYHNNETLLKCCKKIMVLGNQLTKNKLRNTLKIYSGSQMVSNFRPTAAACIYHHFDCKGKTVWDMSCGYGGRLLGAEVVGVGKYIGTEPCDLTYKGLQEMSDELVTIPIEIHKCGSEEYEPESESLDFCFTSPPYFNTEKYSDEENQSWIKYPTKDEWLNGFLKKTFENCFLGLKKNGKMVINIANVKSYPTLEDDTVRVAEGVGFKLIDTWKLSLSSMPSADTKFKYEPIFIFQKV